jgi:hypothetical protein
VEQTSVPKWKPFSLFVIRWINNYGNKFGKDIYQPQTGKGIYIRTFCQKNEGSVETKQRPTIRWVVALLTGHCHLKGHLLKLGLTDNLTCERCLQEDESATHILYDCEATAYLRFRHLGQFFVEPSDFYDTPLIKVLHFIQSVGLIKG